MVEINDTLETTIITLVENKKFSTLRDILGTMNCADLAALFLSLPPHILPLLFRLLPKELAAETFVEMDTDAQEMLIRGFSDSELREVVNELYVDDAVDIVEEMPANVVKRILTQANPEMRKMINDILQYPDDSAGSIMTPEFVSLREQMTVKEAIAHIRQTGFDKETINNLYITDQNKKLISTISIRTLILADENSAISDLMEPSVISVNTLEDRESVVAMFTKYGFIALPVVDGENRLVGIVTVDDAMDVLQEETTEDIEKMAAITPSDRPYMRTSIFDIFKSRIPWLFLLMILATFTGIIISNFEHALKSHVVLAVFIPMLMNTGGNSGSQASVTVIRGLALGELSLSDILKVVFKETQVAFLCGIVLAGAGFIKFMWLDQVGLTVSIVVSLTLVITVIFAKVVGCTLPMLAKKAGFDPAVMASPLITTLVDAFSLMIYFNIASLLLNI